MALTTEPNLRQANSAYNDLAYEDLMDTLERVDPQETPLYTLAQREYELGNSMFAWELDGWPAVQGAVGPGDGYAVQTGEVRDVTASVRKMGNTGQAFRRVFGAGWIANAVPKLPGTGRGKLIAKGAADAMVLLKQDMEAAFGSLDQTAVLDQGGATGGTMAGLLKLIDPANVYTGASAFAYGKPPAEYSAPAGACISGAIASFNLTAIRTIAKALRTAVHRNKDYVLLCGLDLREKITGLTDPATVSATSGALASSTIRMFSQSLADAELGISIDVVRTDWGRWLVVPTELVGHTLLDADGSPAADDDRASRVLTSRAKCGYLVSRDKLFKRFGVTIESEELASDGGGKRKQARCYATLGTRQPQGFGYFLYAT